MCEVFEKNDCNSYGLSYDARFGGLQPDWFHQ